MNEQVSGIVGEISAGAFANPYMREILRAFGPAAFLRSSGTREFEHFLRANHVRGKTCLEIGTFHGVTAVLLSQFFERVISVSVDVSPSKLLKRDICAHLGIDKIEFHDARDNSEKKRIVDALEFDFAYVDGDHARDTASDFDLVRRCRHVLFHEYWPAQAPVWNLVNALPPDQVRRALFDCFALWDGRHG